jgi:hypothetical protein
VCLLVLIVVIPSRQIYWKKNFSAFLDSLYAVGRTNVTNIFAAFHSDCAKRERKRNYWSAKEIHKYPALWSKVNVSHIPVYLYQDISTYIYRSVISGVIIGSVQQNYATPPAFNIFYNLLFTSHPNIQR